MNGVIRRGRTSVRVQMGAAALVVAVTLLGVLLVGARAASSGYRGTVDTATKTVTLVGSGDVRLSTGGGVLHHGDLGAGFAGSEDFDSTRSGVQTVPDTGQWKVNVRGGGRDTLEVDEGEPAKTVSYSSGHTFVPGGVPCMVRDPHDHHGLVAFSVNPKSETEFCYPRGIDNVIVRGGPGSVQYGILDTQPGVPLHLYGSAHSTNSIEEVAGVPTEVGGFHNPMSPVYFSGGRKPAQITFNDGITKKPAKYAISRSEIVKSGLPPLHYSTQSLGSELILYPQVGPSKVAVGPTGGIAIQIFGNYLGQKGPDHVDASRADAQVYIDGTPGSDTILASPAGGYVAGDGGNDTIHARNDFVMYVVCASSGTTGTAFVTTKDIVHHCRTVHRAKPVVVLKGVSFTPSRLAAGSALTLRVPPYAEGELKLTFELTSCHCGKGSVSKRIRAGTTSLHLRKRLPKGKYQVGVQLTSGGIRSKTHHTSLVIR